MRLQALPILLATTGLALAATPHSARADDAYVCDGGRLVYARPETLEKLKQTDPCIAQYYGLPLVKPAALAPASPAAAPATAAQRPAPAARPAAVVAPLAPASAPNPAWTPAVTASPGKLLKGTVTRSVGTVAVAPAVAKALPKQPDAAPDTDFRNIKLLNAKPGEATVYHHGR